MTDRYPQQPPVSANYRLITSSPIEVRQDLATGDVVIRNIHDPHSAIVATGDEWTAFADQMAAPQNRTTGETVPPDGRQRVPYVFNLDASSGEVTYRAWGDGPHGD